MGIYFTTDNWDLVDDEIIWDDVHSNVKALVEDGVYTKKEVIEMYREMNKKNR